MLIGKAVKTSSQAGLTRAISNVIKVVDDPPIYMSDSPGYKFLRAKLISRGHDALHTNSRNIPLPRSLRLNP